MRNMTADTMMQANGGRRWKYECDSCNAKFKTKFAIIAHIVLWHAGFSSYHRL